MAHIDSNNAAVMPKYRQMATGKAFHMGIIAAFVTILIWSCFLLAMRAGAQSTLTTFDLAILRYALPGLVLLPWFKRDWRQVLGTSPWILLGVLIGAGVPFFYLSSLGAGFAPAAHSGVLVPGTFPLFVTGIAVLVYKEPLSKQRLLGLSCIALGVLSLLAASLLQPNSSVWKGDLIFLVAAFLWAIYTVCLRLAGLPPLAMTGFLSLVSTLILIVMYLTGSVKSGFSATPMPTIVIQFFVQAILVGIVAGFTYGFAINRIGAERSAAIGSLTPVLVTLLAVPLLHEYFATSSIWGLSLVCLGVLLASGLSLPFFSSRREV